MAISNNSPCVLKEWAPLSDLLNKIPTKPNLSIFSEEVKITCIDILPEFIALGTNYGMAYWYDRNKRDLQRLRCENSNVPITSIKVLSTVDFMLACGSKIGNISIFQIPKTHPDWIPEQFKTKNKHVERYTVSDLHKSAISALEWSKNGMKLFSGDENGTVVLTELDFYMHICKSLVILNESYGVVQLSYSNPNLVVSTTYRSIICERSDKWNVVQVGQKDRKILGMFGGIIQHDKLKNKKLVIYCTRPGLRIWLSDVQGNVHKTLLFKDLLNQDCTEVPLLNPVSKNLMETSSKEINFGKIFLFKDNLLLTYNSSAVYILDPESMTVVSKITRLRRVLDVACHKDEIFILEEHRNLIRISTKPESNNEYVNISSVESSFFPSSIRGLTSKLQPSNILAAIPPVIEQAFTYNINEHTDGELVVNAEEAVETYSERLEEVELPRAFENIEEDESVDIIYKHKKKHKKKTHRDKHGIVSNSLSSNSSNEDNINIIRPTIMNLSTVGALPDLRSPTSIQSDIEYKEKILADVLNFDKKLHINLCNDEQSQPERTTVIKKEQVLDIVDERSSTNSFKNKCDTDFSKSNTQKINEKVGLIRDFPVKSKSIEMPRCARNDLRVRRQNVNDEVALTKDIPLRGSKEAPDSLSENSRQKIRDELDLMNGIPIVPRSPEIPACVNIPNGWNLSSVKMKSTTPDSSFSDWELL